MDNPSRYAARPLAFLACYVRARPCSHAAIMMAVVGAVGCSVGAQYAVKVLVDTLAGGLYVGTNARDAWLGFLLLATLIAVDNLLWRLASWIASYTFVAVTGDLCHLGQGPDGFMAAAEAALAEAAQPDPVRVAARQALARASAWDRRVAAFSALLDA